MLLKSKEEKGIFQQFLGIKKAEVSLKTSADFIILSRVFQSGFASARKRPYLYIFSASRKEQL